MNASARAAVERVRSGLELVLLSDERTDERHTELRLELDAVPPSSRGRAWRETSILVQLAFRKRPAATFKKLRRMRNRRGEEFGGFWEECRRALAPYTLGPHGYTLALTPEQLRGLRNAIDALLRPHLAGADLPPRTRRVHVGVRAFPR